MSTKPVTVRGVWAHNLEVELSLIDEIIPHYSFASMDTEYPGVICLPNIDPRFCSQLHPLDKYRFMKTNIDALNLIQLGLTLSDSQGNLPDLGTNSCYIWEFNFRDFDLDRDPHNPASIELLKRQGIDFGKNREEGIDSMDFARLVLKSRLVFNRSSLTWVTFQSAYDFGFLIKVLIRQELPDDVLTTLVELPDDMWMTLVELPEDAWMIRRELPADVSIFMRLVNLYFGVRVFDMKHMMKFCDGLYGGLERVAKSLEVDRVAGKSHQAGSDSLLTLQTFMKMKDRFLAGRRESHLNEVKNVLFGLEPVWIKRVGEERREENRIFLRFLYLVNLNRRERKGGEKKVVRKWVEKCPIFCV